MAFIPETPVYSSAFFSWNSEFNNFSAWASDLGLKGGIPTAIGLVSSKTNESAYFSCSHTEVDREGEVMYWEYVTSDPSLEKFPNLKGVSVIIYND